MRFFNKAGLISLGLLASTTIYAADAALEDEASRFSYSLGVQIGSDLKTLKGLDFEIFVSGFKDGMTGAQAKINEAERMQVIQSYQMKAMQQLSQENLEAGSAFLAENKSKPGVKSTASGLQYKVVKAGTGATPSASDTVSVHYRGTLINGEEFDSSFSRGQPATFPVGGVIKGWTEALQMMKVGAKWQLFIPANLAYGPRGPSPKIGPNSTLIFDVELLDVVK